MLPSRRRRNADDRAYKSVPTSCRRRADVVPMTTCRCPADCRFAVGSRRRPDVGPIAKRRSARHIGRRTQSYKERRRPSISGRRRRFDRVDGGPMTICPLGRTGVHTNTNLYSPSNIAQGICFSVAIHSTIHKTHTQTYMHNRPFFQSTFLQSSQTIAYTLPEVINSGLQMVHSNTNT